MALILGTDEFTVESAGEPHHSRENGGHIIITPVGRYQHRHELPLELAAKLMHLTMVVGEAFLATMKAAGLDVTRINYQDNGNWAYKEPRRTPQLHIHLYMRSWGERHPADDSRFRAFPDALVFPDPGTDYYDAFVSLSVADCDGIREKVLQLLSSEKYQSLQLNPK